jgi:DGQHR domain-containing protein
VAAKNLRLPALAIRQGERTLYSFAVQGSDLASFATISRIHRAEGRLGGYQRPEALAHIASIRRYLESSGAILPNALVIAFDERVKFKALKGGGQGCARSGELQIPLLAGAAEDKPGWIVDGQQRSAALREAELKDFPVFITAFIAETVAEQRSQFILVNSTKPLPKGLIYELLPETPAADLPVSLLRRRFPALLLERLNLDEDSPLQYRIRTPTIIDGMIKDNSVLSMLSASIEDGALYSYFDAEVGGGDTEAMLTLLKNYWAAVAETFPEAWDRPPRESRLIHGVGIISLGCLMDEIAYSLGEKSTPPTQAEFAAELATLATRCAWTEGVWRIGADELAWNQLQNTPKDILCLSDHLLAIYREDRGGLTRAA